MYLNQSNNLTINIKHIGQNTHHINLDDLHDASVDSESIEQAFHNSNNHKLCDTPNQKISSSKIISKNSNLNHSNSFNSLINLENQPIKNLGTKSSLSLSPTPSISSTTSFLSNNLIDYSSHSKQLSEKLTTIDLIKNNQEESNEFIGVDPLTRFLSLHLQYLELFEKFQHFILRGDGPLQYTVRHYIAIMAAARHHCKYLINDQLEEFKHLGGDLNWLKGIGYAPKKIQNLNEINKILAHQPWLLTKEHIERLTKGDNNWSLSELVQAIVIMAHFHTLSSFVFGCGFNETDRNWSSKAPATPSCNYNSNNISDLLNFRTHISSAPPSPPSTNAALSLNELIQPNSPYKFQQQSKQQQNSPNHLHLLHQANQQASTNTLDILMRKMQCISEQKQSFEFDKQEELVKNQSLEIHLTPTQMTGLDFNLSNSPTGTINSQGNNFGNLNGFSNPATLNKNNELNECSAGLSNSFMQNTSLYDDGTSEISKFVVDAKFCYADFARQRALTDVATFRIQDYSWSDHAYSLVNRLYSDVGTMLDEKFFKTYTLTYRTMGRKTDVDTSVFRRAIWNYIQCMYGIRHDDYDYHEVNELLEKSLKKYIKTVCCFPHQTLRKDCDTVMREFRRSEKIHVNIMITEARLQAELLYALRTIMRYLT